MGRAPGGVRGKNEGTGRVGGKGRGTRRVQKAIGFEIERQ
jgi:hypothetical protein